MGKPAVSNVNVPNTGTGFGKKIVRDYKMNKELYILALPVILFFVIFHYRPMYGVIIAFKQYSPMEGILGSKWVGFKHFIDFFQSYYFWRTVRNTVWISLNTLVWGFPAPIILALLINEIRSNIFKRSIQTITYLPHFVSTVVICGMIKTFTADTGIVNYIIGLFGGEQSSLLNKPESFVPIYVISGIWQEVGWGSIIYLAALMGIDQELYEASYIDGAGRWRQTLHITLPGIAPTIVILLILRLGSMMNVGFEKILLLYNPAIYDTSDVISTYVYRKGLIEFNWSFSSAVGLFNTVINFALLIISNKISKKVNETSLW